MTISRYPHHQHHTHRRRTMKHLTLTTVITTWLLFAIQTSAFFQPHNNHHHQASSRLRVAEEWKGEVASNTADGRIMGCVITSVSETEFCIRIDG
eukprot:scaffold73555_cov37-Cyclotella_meneghiniana.AAC.3